MGYSTTASLLAALLTAGCSFHIGSAVAADGVSDLATTPEGDLAGAPGDLAAAAGDLAAAAGDLAAAAPDLAGGQPILLGTRDPLGAVTVDLSAEGGIDWAHFGRARPTDVNRKNVNSAAIALVTTGAEQQSGSNAPAFAWNDGTPTAAEAGTHGGVFVGANGDHFILTVPATRAARTLRIWVGEYKAMCTLRAQLSDHSAPDYADDRDAGNGTIYSRYTIQFAAAHDDAQLQITWIIDNQHGMGSATLLAAALR